MFQVLLLTLLLGTLSAGNLLMEPNEEITVNHNQMKIPTCLDAFTNWKKTFLRVIVNPTEDFPLEKPSLIMDKNLKKFPFGTTSRKKTFLVFANSSIEVFSLLDLLGEVDTHVYLVLEEKENLERIFASFWKNGVFDVTILVRKEKIWSTVRAQPFAEGSSCGKKVILKTTEGCKHQEIPKSYLRCPFRATALSKIFVFPYVTNYGREDRGILTRPLSLVAAHHGVELTWVVEDLQKTKYLMRNHSHFREYLLEGNLDAMVFAYQDESDLTYLAVTHTIQVERMVWVVPVPKLLPPLKLFTQAYTKEVWWCIWAIFIMMTFAAFFLGKLEGERFAKGLVQSLMLVYSSSLSYSNHYKVNSKWIRGLLVLFLVYSFHVCILYQGKYFSLLTVPPYEKPIENVEELVDSGLEMQVHAYGVENIYKTGEHPDKFMERVSSVHTDGLARLKFLSEHQNMSTNVLEAYVALDSEQKFVTFPDGYVQVSYKVYCMRRGHPLFGIVDEGLTRLVEGGFQWKFLEDLKTRKKVNGDGKVVLGLRHLRGVFLLLGIGLGVGSLAFALEVSWGFLGRSGE